MLSSSTDGNPPANQAQHQPPHGKGDAHHEENWFEGCTTLQALKERYKELAKRISKEKLLEYAEEKAKEAKQYESALERFPDALAQYNNIVPYVQDLRNQLMTLMLLTKFSYRDF